MELIEHIPMPPQSLANIEIGITKFLSMACPEHLLFPESLDIQMLNYILWNKLGYKEFMVDNFDDPDMEAMTDFSHKVIYLPKDKYYKDLKEGKPRCKFTLAHETGHIILHADYVVNILQVAARNSMTTKYREPKIFEKAEWQANTAAGALLMPLTTLWPLIRKCQLQGYTTNDIIEVIQDEYDVSKGSASIRLENVMKSNLDFMKAIIEKNNPACITGTSRISPSVLTKR